MAAEGGDMEILISEIRKFVIEGKWKLVEAKCKKHNIGGGRLASAVWNTFC